MNSEHAAKGSEHLQQAARELIGAARSFLDAAEELFEDSDFVDDAAAAIRTVADDLGTLVRQGAANGGPSSADTRDESTGATTAPSGDVGHDDGASEPNSAPDVTGGAESTTAGGDDATYTRVRRIDVE